MPGILPVFYRQYFKTFARYHSLSTWVLGCGEANHNTTVYLCGCWVVEKLILVFRVTQQVHAESVLPVHEHRDRRDGLVVLKGDLAALANNVLLICSTHSRTLDSSQRLVTPVLGALTLLATAYMCCTFTQTGTHTYIHKIKININEF